jgi:membrane associated rhomboid family serine protease
MRPTAAPPLEAILRLCEAAAPQPWYPSAYVRATGTPREQLDPHLDGLRMAGLIRLTDWVPGDGQGYVLTPEGVEALRSPRLLSRLRSGNVPLVVSSSAPAAALEQARHTPWARGEAVREAFLGSFTPTVTLALLFANIAVFLVGLALAASRGVSVNDYLAGGDRTGAVGEVQRDIGFLDGPDVYVRGQWWRLLTACFGHVGWVHLAVNMYSLYAVGPLLERLWGSGRFLLLYLLAGLGGSCGMLIENPLGGGAGASGALWGVMASLATWMYLNRRALPGQLVTAWRRQLVVVFALNVFLTFGWSQISKGAHFGGGLTGLVAAVPLDLMRFGPRVQRRLALLGLVALPILSIGLLLGSFVYTGPLIAYQYAADSYNAVRVALLNGQPDRRVDPRQGRATRAELADAQAALDAALRTPARRAPFWLPSYPELRRIVDQHGPDLAAKLTAVRAELESRRAAGRD